MDNKRGRGRPKKIIEEKLENEIISTPEIAESKIEPKVALLEPNISDNNSEFLSELNNENFKDEQINESTKEDKAFINSLSKKKSKPQKETEDELFSDKGTELLGKDRRKLIAKLNQYKNLFKSELKGFKVKRGASLSDLQAAIEEADSIVETSSVGGFINDSILSCIKLIEGVSSRTSYNVSGMSEMLRGNPQFTSLMKQMYLKYEVFSRIPPETQLIMLVATTAYICKSKNANKAQYNEFLNQPYIPPPTSTN